LLGDHAGERVARLGPIVDKIGPDKAGHLLTRFGDG
jgi:hypothetical protein